MKVKALGVLRSKLFKPCTKVLFFFELRLRLKKPLFIRLRPLNLIARRRPPRTTTFKPKPMIMSSPSSSFSFLSVFRSPKRTKPQSLTNTTTSTTPHESTLFPSPNTPKCEGVKEVVGVEEACRSFEKYLVEMIVEEGNTKDLMDVEEVLRCWKNLKSPVFIHLVSRFYAELCKDLFSSHPTHQEPLIPH